MQRINSVKQVVDDSLNKRQNLIDANSALLWSFLNLICCLLIYLDINFFTALKLSRFPDYNMIIKNLEYILLGWFILKCLRHFVKFLTKSNGQTVELTNSQKHLLGIKDSEKGFKTLTKEPETEKKDSSLIFSPSTSTPRGNILNQTSYSESSGIGCNSPYTPTGSLTPLHLTPPSLNWSFSSSPSNSFNPFDTSYNGFPSGDLENNLNYVFSASPYGNNSSLSPRQILNSSSFCYSSDVNRLSYLRARRHVTSPNLNTKNTDIIMDNMRLDTFLKNEQFKDQSRLSDSSEINKEKNSFWKSGGCNDYLSHKNVYQLSTSSAQSTKSFDNDPYDCATYKPDEVWMHMNVSSECLEVSVESLRKWIGQSILLPLVEEINKINLELSRIGCDEFHVGNVSLSTLNQIALNKQHALPNLHALIPYLDIASNQEYLVKRLKELGSGGAMSNFKWNGGSAHKGKEWSEHLPTDSSIIIHLFCTYMDSRLPAHPNFPDGKTFTNQYFMKTPDKPDLKKKDNLIIHQSSINPPHFQVVIGDDTWDLKKARSNLFHAILLFLHRVKSNEYGMLGRINLGFSGVNILWIVNNDK